MVCDIEGELYACCWESDCEAAVIRGVAPTNFSELALNGFSLVGGFELGVGDLGDGRRLALQGNIPLTNGLAVLARVLNEKGEYGLEPLERFTTDASGKLTSLEPNSSDRLTGLDGSGQFVLVGVQNSQVLLSGIARNVTSQPAEGLSVRSAGTPWLAFSKFKKLLRDGAERTVDKLWKLCGSVLDQFTESECRNYFQHCGYRYT